MENERGDGRLMANACRPSLPQVSLECSQARCQEGPSFHACPGNPKCGRRTCRCRLPVGERILPCLSVSFSSRAAVGSAVPFFFSAQKHSISPALHLLPAQVFSPAFFSVLKWHHLQPPPVAFSSKRQDLCISIFLQPAKKPPKVYKSCIK